MGQRYIRTKRPIDLPCSGGKLAQWNTHIGMLSLGQFWGTSGVPLGQSWGSFGAVRFRHYWQRSCKSPTSSLEVHSLPTCTRHAPSLDAERFPKFALPSVSYIVIIFLPHLLQFCQGHLQIMPFAHIRLSSHFYSSSVAHSNTVMFSGFVQTIFPSLNSMS